MWENEWYGEPTQTFDNRLYSLSRIAERIPAEVVAGVPVAKGLRTLAGVPFYGSLQCGRRLDARTSFCRYGSLPRLV